MTTNNKDGSNEKKIQNLQVSVNDKQKRTFAPNFLFAVSYVQRKDGSVGSVAAKRKKTLQAFRSMPALWTSNTCPPLLIPS